ncbi:MAG: PspC domain-containing protein [Spirochaetaceae bacterium]|nr:PspC domain-containing protein [Spirochaetaceae bacterium]
MAGYYTGRRKLHRSRNGEILGVCKGIAEWRDLPVDAVRLVFILLVLFGGMSIWIYFILALILPVEPEYREESRRQRRPRQSSSEDIDTDFENLKERVKKMEDEEFDKEKDWENRFTKGR